MTCIRILGIILLITAYGHSANAQDIGAGAEPPANTASGAFSISSHERSPKVEATPHYWRTLLELSASIGVGTTWYWVNEERQVADWDYPSWKEKLTFDTDIMIFDNNDFEVNYTWHTFAGGSSHLLGRSNGLGIYESFAFGTLASVFWEYGIEARELISINDLLVTNTTGLATGEFFHRLGQYVNMGQQGLGWDVARWTLGVGHTAHAALDKQAVAQDLELIPNFRVFYSLERTDATRQDGGAAEESASTVQHTVGFDGKIIAMDNYRTAGERRRWFGSANVTRFDMHLSRGDGYTTQAGGSTLLAGYRYQNFPKADEFVGRAVNIGTSIGYLYQREEYGVWRNQLGGLHAPGLAVDGELIGNGWALRGGLQTSVDLMGVNALGWQQFQEQEGDEVGKSILQNTGYYYSYGASVRAHLSLEMPRWSIGAKAFAGTYTSIEGFDRARDEIGSEVSGDDQVMHYEAFARANIHNGTYARLRWGQSVRHGELGGYSADANLGRANLELGLDF